MDNSFLQNAVKGIPEQYRVLVEPSFKAGEKLGNEIARRWDNLVDWVFSGQK